MYPSEVSYSSAISTPQSDADPRGQLTVIYTLHHNYGTVHPDPAGL